MPIFDSGLEALRKKYGPFSGWTWGTIAAAGIGGYLLFFHKGKPKLSISPTIGEGMPLGPTPYGNPGGGPGGGVTSPTPPTTTPTPPVVTTTPPIDKAVPQPPVLTNVPGDNYIINTPSGSKVTAVPEAFNHPAALQDFLHNADIQKSITDSINPQLSENAQFAYILRQQIESGTLTPDARVSFGANQHGTANEAITYYEQADRGRSTAVGSPNNVGSPAAAGASQGYNI